MSESVQVAAEPAVEEIRVADRELWGDGAPLETFRRLRRECPVHWSDGMSDYPGAPGFWSLTRQAEIREVSRDWRTFSSEAGGILAHPAEVMPVAVQNQMFIGMDPPKHDRLKALFMRGFTPKRIAVHEDRIREIARGVLDGVAGRETVELVEEVAQPIVARVIGSFMGIEPEDDAVWARLLSAMVKADDPDVNPEGPAALMQRDMPQVVARCQALIADRRAQPRDDLLSVLVHAEVDGERLTDAEIVMGFYLLMVAGNDSTKATYSAGMMALLEHPEQRRRLLEDPSLVPGAVEEALRMYPAFAHFRRTATRDTVLAGRQIRRGDSVVMWYPSSGRDEAVYDDPDAFDVTRDPEHQAFGAGGRHFCLGSALARLELRVMFEETLRRFPAMQLAGEPRWARAIFVNQLTSLPVRPD